MINFKQEFKDTSPVVQAVFIGLLVLLVAMGFTILVLASLPIKPPNTTYSQNVTAARRLVETEPDLEPLYVLHMRDGQYRTVEYTALLDAYVRLRSGGER